MSPLPQIKSTATNHMFQTQSFNFHFHTVSMRQAKDWLFFEHLLRGCISPLSYLKRPTDRPIEIEQLWNVPCGGILEDEQAHNSYAFVMCSHHTTLPLTSVVISASLHNTLSRPCSPTPPPPWFLSCYLQLIKSSPTLVPNRLFF